MCWAGQIRDYWCVNNIEAWGGRPNNSMVSPSKQRKRKIYKKISLQAALWNECMLANVSATTDVLFESICIIAETSSWTYITTRATHIIGDSLSIISVSVYRRWICEWGKQHTYILGCMSWTWPSTASCTTDRPPCKKYTWARAQESGGREYNLHPPEKLFYTSLYTRIRHEQNDGSTY